MAVGQQVLSGVASLERLRAAEEELEQVVAEEGAVHVRKLCRVLALHGHYAADGLSLSAVPAAARLLRCSEWRADRLLDEGMLLTTLPGALEAISAGVLTVEQSSVVVTQLRQVADVERRLGLWRRLVERLRRPEGAALPPARLKVVLQRWIAQSDPADAEQRRKTAEEERRVDYRRREDGLVDILLLGVAAPLAQSVLQRIRAQAEPVGLFDERLADQRRLDAAVDLLLGRTGTTCGTGSDTVGSSGGGSGSGGPGCGCWPGMPAPCGMDAKLLVPIGAALGTTDEVATLVGHGPIEPDLLAAALLNSPRLRAVFVDGNGVPVALGRGRITPPRGDAQALRAALLELVGSAPGRWFPRHPHDHPRRPDDHPRRPDDHPSRPDDRPATPQDRWRPPDEPGRPPDPDRDLGPGRPPGRPRLADEQPPDDVATDPATDLGLPAAPGGPHPPSTPGPYAVTGLLRELIFIRAPLCEFPGCGARAELCDAEHDLAFPDGPTCSCNLGPCCRRHHRAKQQGWTKIRQADSAVTWTSPTGRAWTSPSQHQPPAAAVRPVPTLPAPDPLDELSPTFADDELWELLDRPDDPAAYELRATDREPGDLEPGDLEPGDLDAGDPDPDRLGDDTRWTVDLTDPYAWTDPPVLG